jgi:membrane associated rhomboid family serine protease
VLTSQAIPFLQVEQAGHHVLLVDEHWAAAAAEELRRYEEENRGWRLRRVLPPAAPFARSGSAALALVLVVFGLAQWLRAWGLDWLALGAADAVAIRAGEAWRAATALTLHADLPHLLSNLFFGLAFAYLVAHSHGGGLGALAVLLAGVLGNFTNAWAHAGEHLSIGASTSVFGAVGLLCGSEARVRHLLREPRARRAAPVGAALALLAYLGVGEVQPARSIDVLAHLFGLVWGFLLGTFLPSVPRVAVERAGVQLACGLVALLLLGLAWGLALRA